jgi:hypothetical protein
VTTAVLVGALLGGAVGATAAPSDACLRRAAALVGPGAPALALHVAVMAAGGALVAWLLTRSA